MNTFDLATAVRLCDASAAAYSIPDSDSCILDSRSDTVVRLTRSETDTVIAFRGTTDLRNWLTDLDCAWDLEDYCRIHRGFARALDSVQSQITSEVFSSCREGRRIWLTGHSLGGALAMLYAWRFFVRCNAMPFSGVYTYGQPRVGNAAFRDSYNFVPELRRATFRVIHADDLVPRVPWLLGAYRHAGHEVFFPTAGGEALKGSQGSTESHPTGWMVDPSAFAKLPWDLRNCIRELRHGQFALLADHHVSTYQSLFRAEQTLTTAEAFNL